MAVAAPARKTAPAPAPSRTAPPRKKAAAPATAPREKAAPARQPRTRPKPKGRSVAAPAAPARKVPARRKPARKAPTRAPSRVKTRAKTARSVGGQLIPLAGRTAVAVGQLPDSGLVVRMTRGRAWIAVLGLLLVGIVALNVVTLSFAASTGDIDANITALEQENPVLRSIEARNLGTGQIRQAAVPLGLAMAPTDTIQVIEAGPDDVAVAAQRLAAISPE